MCREWELFFFSLSPPTGSDSQCSASLLLRRFSHFSESCFSSEPGGSSSQLRVYNFPLQRLWSSSTQPFVCLCTFWIFFFYFFFLKLKIGSSSITITAGNQTSCSTTLVAVLFFLSLRAAFPWTVSVFLDSVDFTVGRLDFGDSSPTPPKLKPQQRKLHSGGLWLLIGVCFLYCCCYVTGEGNQHGSATSPCTLVRGAGCVCQSLERGERAREGRVCFTVPNTTASGMSQ